MVTLSLVMTGWGGKSATCSFKDTFLTTRMTKGTFTCGPWFHTAWNWPSHSTT